MENDNKILKLKEKYHLKLNDEETKIWIHPDSHISFTSNPLPKDLRRCILVSADEYMGLMVSLYMFNENYTEVIDFVDPTPKQEEELKKEFEESELEYKQLYEQGLLEFNEGSTPIETYE